MFTRFVEELPLPTTMVKKSLVHQWSQMSACLSPHTEYVK